jgi:hypothetical protein
MEEWKEPDSVNEPLLFVEPEAGGRPHRRRGSEEIFEFVQMDEIFLLLHGRGPR